MEWALSAERSGQMRPELRLVLLAYAWHASPDGTGTWPSHGTVATRLGITDRAVRRSVKALEESGRLVRGDQSQVAHLRADRRPTVFDLPIHEGAKVSGRTHTTGRARSQRGGKSVRHDRAEVSSKPSTEGTTETDPPNPPSTLCTCHTEEQASSHPIVYPCALHNRRVR